MRKVYVVRPYRVGSKNAMSTAVVIPRTVVKDYKIDASTVVILKTNSNKRRMTLETFDAMQATSENVKSIGVSLSTSSRTDLSKLKEVDNVE
jgi:hypothetical protein